MGEHDFKDTWNVFVYILSNDIVTSEAMIDVLKKAEGILNSNPKIFLSQSNDSKQLVIQKRFWMRWLIRRLIALCIQNKGWPKVIEGCRETLELIMRKAIAEPVLLYTLIEHYVILLEGK